VKRRRQGGAALLALVGLLALGISYLFLSGMASDLRRAADARARNGQILLYARQSLVGHVAHQALLASEDNPGRLPCPEAAAYPGTANEGIASGSCRLPAVGRLPWRTLGVEKLLDASGEPLWYVVSPGWALQSASASLAINSDTPGALTVDGRPNAAVALIIAPGAPLGVPAAAGCAPRTQSRHAPPLDLRDYLDCDNATSPADASFVTSGPPDGFNDQVLRVTAADLLPALEAAIAKRIERDVVPALRAAYAAPEWGTTSANPVFPFAARFADASGGFNPDAHRGSAGLLQGLLPLTRASGCDPAAEPRCDPAHVAWTSAPAPAYAVRAGSTMTVYAAADTVPGSNCAASATEVRCTLYTTDSGTLLLDVSATARNVAMALRRLDKTVVADGFAADGASTPRGAVALFNADGSAALTFSATVNAMGGPASCVRRATGAPVACVQRSVAVPIQLLADHALLDPAPAATGWFLRNNWHSLAYYALAPGHAASSPSPRACTASPATCLNVLNLPPANRQRALIVLAGRSLSGAARPSGNLADYLDSAENRNGDGVFEQRPASARFNDRIIVVDANP